MRVFIAIELNDKTRLFLEEVQSKLRSQCPGVRWVQQEHLHLTVQFLGETGDSDVEKIISAVECAAQRSSSFELELQGCGCFPQSGHVRVIWVGAREHNNRLQLCAESVRTELTQAGFPGDGKPFQAHVTLGRVKFDNSAGRIHNAVETHRFTPISDHIEHVTVMQSFLSRGGPTYMPLSRVALGKNDLQVISNSSH